jgi:hypothetical protein
MRCDGFAATEEAMSQRSERVLHMSGYCARHTRLKTKTAVLVWLAAISLLLTLAVLIQRLWIGR